MGAVFGNGREYDINCYPEDYLKTTTSLYKCVGMVGGTTTSDWTVQLCGHSGTVCGATAGSNFFLGINQTGKMSTGTEICSVRMFGLSKAVCAESITAGEWVRPYQGADTTTCRGGIVAIDDAVTVGSYGQSVASHTTVIGRALEDGSTGTVIAVFVNPQLYDGALIST